MNTSKIIAFLLALILMALIWRFLVGAFLLGLAALMWGLFFKFCLGVAQGIRGRTKGGMAA